MASWYIGALINLVGSIMINLGTNLMKLGHNTRLDLPVGDRPPVRRFRSWQLGVGLFGVGNFANFISFGFAAQSLLAALGSIQFVSNVLFGWLVLEERVTKQITIATALIPGGCILLMVYGNHESPILTVPQLLALYRKPAYITYLCVLSVSALTMFLVYQYGRIKFEALGLSFQQVTGGWGRLLPISFATYSGMLGAQSVQFGKTLSLIVRAAAHGDNQLASGFTAAVLVMFLAAAAFWVTRLNKALRLFPGLVIVPTMQISWTLFSILAGMVYFEEYRALTPVGAMMSCIGVLVIFAGVFLLTRVRKPKRKTMEAGDSPGDAMVLLGDSLSGSRTSSDHKALRTTSLGNLLLAGHDSSHPALQRLRTLLATATDSCTANATFTPLASYASVDGETAEELLLLAGDDNMPLIGLVREGSHSLAPVQGDRDVVMVGSPHSMSIDMDGVRGGMRRGGDDKTS